MQIGQVSGRFGLAGFQKNMRSGPWHRSLVLVLIFGLAFPYPLFAAEGSPREASHEVSKSAQEIKAELSLAEFQKAILESGSNSTRLALTAVQRNVGFLLTQELIDTHSGKTWDLTEEDLNRPKVPVPAGIISRTLVVDRVAGGVVLALEDNRYAHRIRLNPGVELVDFDWDSDVVELLLSDGSRHVIEVSALGPTAKNMGLLYAAPIPVFFLGQPKSLSGLTINRLKILQRRVDPIDKSRAAQEARIDRNPSTRRRGLQAASSMLVKQIEENLVLVQPIPLAPELEAQLRAASQDGMARLNAGDTALIHFDGAKETIVGIDDRIQVAGMIGLQMGPLSGLWYVASPESAQATQEIFNLRASAKSAIVGIFDDDAAIADFFQSGLQRSLSRVPASALNATNAYALKIAARVSELKKLQTPEALRDAFTLQQQIDDWVYYQNYLAELRTESAKHEAKSKWNITRYPEGRRWVERLSAIGTGIRDFDLPKRMRSAANALKKPIQIAALGGALATGAAGIDYSVTEGQNVGLATDAMAQVWNHSIDYTVPVMRDLGYVKNMALHSLTTRTGMLLSIFLIAALVRPFCQHSVNKLIASTGIKYFFSYSVIPPQRLVSMLTLRPQLVEAMKHGHLPLELLHPMGMLSHKWNDRVNSASKEIAHANRDRSLATILALSGLAKSQGTDVATLLSSDGIDQKEAAGLALALGDCLSHSGNHELFRDIHASSESFFDSLSKARLLASQLQKGGKKRFLPYLRQQVATDWLRTIGNFQEARFLALSNPQVPQDFADYVSRGYLMDGLFTLMVSSLSGSYADPTHPENLAFQENDSMFWTHKFVWINDWEQIFLHLGASAAVDFLSAGLESKAAFENFRPATEYDNDRVQASRSFGTDSSSALGLLFNLRKNNYAVGFGVRSWNQCIRLLQGFLVIGMGLRLFEGVLDGQALSSILAPEAFEHALVGQLYFIFVAPFVYRWFWAVAITTTRTLQAEINKLGAGFEDHFMQLAVALDRKDFATVQREAEYMIALYDREELKVPENVRASLKSIDGESVGDWANRVLEACRNAPPVPEVSNERTNKSIIFVGSIITTILAGYLMVDSFQQRPFRGFDVPEGQWGFDTNDWWAWNGFSKTDAMPVLMTKSLVNILGIWGAGHLFNMAVDKFNQWRAPTPEAAAHAQSEFNQSVAGLKSMPIVSLTNPRPALLKSTSDTTCAQLFQ